MKKMKNIYFLIIIAVIVTAGCKQEYKTESVDMNDVKNDVIQLADEYVNAWNAKDVDLMNELVADDGIFFGTDPSEMLDKTSLIEMYTQLFSDTATNFGYDVDLRKIKLSDDGNSAIVVDYFHLYDWSPNIPLRHTSQIVKKNNKWVIDFIAWGLIAENEDIEKLNKALE